MRYEKETKSRRKADAIYAPGRSKEERRRLIEQEAFLGGFIRRLFRETCGLWQPDEA